MEMVDIRKKINRSVTNVVEDFDQDGIDFYDLDDNDGFSDIEEVAWIQSKGWKFHCKCGTANHFVTEFQIKSEEWNLSHWTSENQTDIIRVTTSDPDGDELNFSIYGWQVCPILKSMQPTVI